MDHFYDYFMVLFHSFWKLQFYWGLTVWESLPSIILPLCSMEVKSFWFRMTWSKWWRNFHLQVHYSFKETSLVLFFTFLSVGFERNSLWLIPGSETVTERTAWFLWAKQKNRKGDNFHCVIYSGLKLISPSMISAGEQWYCFFQLSSPLWIMHNAHQWSHNSSGCLFSAALLSVLNMEQWSRLFASELKLYFPL